MTHLINVKEIEVRRFDYFEKFSYEVDYWSQNQQQSSLNPLSGVDYIDQITSLSYILNQIVIQLIHL